MTFQGAVIKEQGITFGVLVVKSHVLNNAGQRDQLVRQASQVFGGIPTVLMGQQGGRSHYYGRKDIAQFMSTVPFHAVPWKRYTLN